MTVVVTWKTAKAECKKLGGHLATITDIEEQEIISALLDGRFVYWIGAMGGGEHSTFQWVTNEKFNYTNWWDGEPNAVDSKENVVMLYNNGRWNDLNGGVTQITSGTGRIVDIRYVCEWEHKYNIIIGRDEGIFSFGLF